MLSILSSVFLSVAVAQQPTLSLPVGTGISMSQQAGSAVTPCPLQVNVSSTRAGPGCVLQVLVSLDAVTAGAQFAFYWSTSPTFNTSSDALTLISGLYTQATVQCQTPGTYYLGVTVTKCALCVLGISAAYDLGVYYTINNNVHVDLDPLQPVLTSWFSVGSGSYVYFDLPITAAGSPHFNIQKAVTSQTDSYTHYFGPSSIDYTNSTQAMPYQVSTSTTGDEYMAPTVNTPGNYSFVVVASSVVGGSSTEFRMTFTWNMDASLSYPSGDTCPSSTCSAIYNCADCASSNCYWCTSTYTCQPGAVCGAAAPPTATTSANFTAMYDPSNTVTITTPAPATGASAAIGSSASCPDPNAACNMNTHCTQCVQAKGCVWCNTLGAVGINTGSCSAGQDNNGMKCKDLLVSPYTLAQCPASHASLALIALFLSFLVIA